MPDRMRPMFPPSVGHLRRQADAEILGTWPSSQELDRRFEQMAASEAVAMSFERWKTGG